MALLERSCQHCGASFPLDKPSDPQRFCGKSCAWAATKGPHYNARIARESAAKRGNAQRGRGEGKGYRKLMGRHEHRALAEQKLGRPLMPGEVVHHRDDAKQNNAPDNLDVLSGQSEHAQLHFLGRKHSAEHVRKRMEARLETLRRKREARRVKSVDDAPAAEAA